MAETSSKFSSSIEAYIEITLFSHKQFIYSTTSEKSEKLKHLLKAGLVT